MSRWSGSCACCGGTAETYDYGHMKGTFSPYCRPCHFYPQFFNVLFRIRVLKKDGKIPEGTKCADCPRNATCRDHRDYGNLSSYDFVCHGCNSRRGPADSFPDFAAELSADLKAAGDLSYETIKKRFHQEYEKFNPGVRAIRRSPIIWRRK